MQKISEEILRQFKSQNGVSLYELNEKSPVLLIFLRHFG